MSELPAGWVKVRLGEVADWGSGGTPKADVSAYYGGGIPWAVIGDLHDGLVGATARTITDAGLSNSSAKIVDDDVVLIAMYGSIGKLGLPTIPMATNQAIAFARPKPGVVNRLYLFYYLMHARDGLTTAGKGATQQNISQTVLKAWPISLAPLAEQARVVAAIEEQFSRIDAGVVAFERVHRQIRQIVDAVLEQSFSQIEDDGAPTRPLSLVGSVITGRTPSTASPVYYGGKLPFITPSDFDHGDSVNRSRRYLTNAGAAQARVVPAGSTFATCIGATLGKIAMATVTGAFNQQINAVVPHDDVEPRYLFYALMRPKFIDQMWVEASSTTLPILNKKRFSQLTIPVPLPAVQRGVVDRMDRIRSQVDSLSHSLELGYTRVAQLRSAVLSDAFLGKLVPQDPKDEPASVLLERIAGERASSNGRKPTRARAGRPRKVSA